MPLWGAKFFVGLYKPCYSARLTNSVNATFRESDYFKQLYTSKSTNLNDSEFIEFFNTENALSEETAKTCEGVMSVDECKRALMTMESNKTPGTDGLGTLSTTTW